MIAVQMVTTEYWVMHRWLSFPSLTVKESALCHVKWESTQQTMCNTTCQESSYLRMALQHTWKH